MFGQMELQRERLRDFVRGLMPPRLATIMVVLWSKISIWQHQHSWVPSRLKHNRYLALAIMTAKQRLRLREERSLIALVGPTAKLHKLQRH